MRGLDKQLTMILEESMAKSDIVAIPPSKRYHLAIGKHEWGKIG